MSLSLVMRFAQRTIVSSLVPKIHSLGGLGAVQKFHSVCDNRARIGPSLLEASPLTPIGSACGMKTKAKLKLRCKDCYFVWRQGRKYVMCRSMGRHKQQAQVKHEKNTWIFTAATQGKRAW